MTKMREVFLQSQVGNDLAIGIVDAMNHRQPAAQVFFDADDGKGQGVARRIETILERCIPYCAFVKQDREVIRVQQDHGERRDRVCFLFTARRSFSRSFMASARTARTSSSPRNSSTARRQSGRWSPFRVALSRLSCFTCSSSAFTRCSNSFTVISHLPTEAPPFKF